MAPRLKPPTVKKKKSKLKFKRDRAERVARTSMVCALVQVLVSVLERSSMARGASSGRKEQSGQGVDGETSASTWPGPGRRLQWKSRRASGLSAPCSFLVQLSDGMLLLFLCSCIIAGSLDSC
jgi:hypothetical protein